MGSNCSTVVEHTPYNKDVVGLFTLRCSITLFFLIQNLAVQHGAKQLNSLESLKKDYEINGEMDRTAAIGTR